MPPRTRGPAIPAFTSLAAVFLVACGGPDPVREAPLVARDSAGVRIVEGLDLFRAPAAEWSVDTVPRTRVGLGDGENLYQVSDAILLSDQKLVVADGASSEVRIFGSDGRRIRAFGGEGEGPGEFGSIRRMTRYSADSIAVADSRLHRVTIFDQDGSVGRIELLGDAPELAGTPTVFGLLEDGSIVVRSQDIERRGEPGTVRFEALLHRLHDGRYLPIAAVKGDEYVFFRTAPDALGFGPPPFARRTFLAVRDERVYTLDTAGSTLRTFSSDGPVLEVRDFAPPADATADVVEAYLDGFLAGRPPDAAAEARPVLKEMMEHTTLPTADTLVAGPGGTVWILPYRLPGDTSDRTYTVVEPNGSLARRVSIPFRYELLWTEADAVVVLSRTDLDVEVVSVLQLQPTGVVED